MKILLVRFSSIGDVVLTTPVIRCLANQFDNVEIHYLTKKAFAPLLTQNPHIHTVWSIEKEIIEVVKDLKRENYDLIVDLHNNLRTLRLLLALRRPFTRFNKLNVRKWLAIQKISKKLPELHIVDRYLKPLKSLGVVNDNQGLDYFFQPETKLKLPFPTEKTFACIAIGGQHGTKKMPNVKLSELCQQLDFNVVLIGGKEDRASGEAISNGSSHVFNLCGELTIDESAKILEASSVVITHDTGMMHIASALKKKIVSIWGNTIPEFGMYPYLSAKGSIQFEVPDLGCRPCSKLGYEKCPNVHFKCMNHQDINAISNAVLYLGRED